MIKRVFLILGKNCNANCVYCMQGAKSITPCTFSKKKIDSLIKYFPKEDPIKVFFYGGEPLLYWHSIEYFSNKIKDYNPNIQLAIISNGLLLDNKKADIINSLDIGFSLSHDGKKNMLTRGSNILETNPDPFLRLKSRSIGAVACRINYDFYEIWDYFKEFSNKFAQPKENVHIQLVRDACNNTPTDLFIYNNPDFEKMLDKVFYNLENNIINGNFDCDEFRQFGYLIDSCEKIINPHVSGLACGADLDTCHIDLDGNFYSCHNAIAPNNSIFKTKRLIAGNYNPYILSPQCQNCRALPLCGGGCAVTDKSKLKYGCYLMLQQYDRLLRMIINLHRKGVI